MAEKPRLITIALSPYNELGRWSLDHAGIAYDEEVGGIIFHIFASRRAGGKGTTPALVTEDGTIGESSEIAEWADRNRVQGETLFPDDEAGEEARALMYRWSEELGKPGRRIIWKHLINDPALAGRFWGQRISERQRRWMPTLLRLAKPGTKRNMKLDRGHLESAPVEVRRVFDEVAERLADGGRIVGDRFTGADMAFACMSIPSICPPELPKAQMPQPEDFGPEVAATVHELREHPAGQYALRLFAEER